MTAKPNLQALLAAYVAPIQELEDAFVQLRDDRNLTDGVGLVLDQIGDIVQQPRGGMLDPTYRRFLRARVAANSSRGTVEDMITIMLLLLADEPLAHVHVYQENVATMRIVVSGVADLDTMPSLRDENVMDLLGDAVSAGVRVILEFPYADAAHAFTLNGTPAQGFAQFALLDMDPVWSNVDTVIAARVPGAGQTPSIQTIADGSGTGQFSDGAAAVFHYAAGVTTVANLEAALATSQFLQVYTRGTGAAVLASPGDAHTGAVAGGVDGGKFSQGLDNHST